MKALVVLASLAGLLASHGTVRAIAVDVREEKSWESVESSQSTLGLLDPQRPEGSPDLSPISYTPARSTSASSSEDDKMNNLVSLPPTQSIPRLPTETSMRGDIKTAETTTAPTIVNTFLEEKRGMKINIYASDALLQWPCNTIFEGDMVRRDYARSKQDGVTYTDRSAYSSAVSVYRTKFLADAPCSARPVLLLTSQPSTGPPNFTKTKKGGSNDWRYSAIPSAGAQVP